MTTNKPPMRLWTRFENVCPTFNTDEEAYLNKVLYKNNVLKHKANSTPLTKQQKYAYLSKRVGNRIHECAPKAPEGLSPDLVALYSRQSSVSYYPKTKRIMHVAGTNWPNGMNTGRLPSACESIRIAQGLQEEDDRTFVSIGDN